MAEFRVVEESSDSDSDDEVVMAQLMEEMFERDLDRPPGERGERMDEAERMMLFEMALEAGGNAEMAIRMAFMDGLEPAGAPVVVAARADGAAAVQGAGDGAGVGGGRGPAMDERRAFLRHIMRHRMRHIRAHRGGRLRTEMARLRRMQCEMRHDEQQRDRQSPSEHSCHYCPVKARKLEAAPHLKFRPATLRQQILLSLGYKTYGKTGVQSADNLPLPDAVIAEVKRVHEELQRWRQDNKRFDETLRDSTIYRCFLADLHWIPGKTVIDRRATARMILQCDVGFYKPNEFLLAAANCLQDEVTRLWPLLDLRTREHWASGDNPYSKNPVFMYWISKCANQPARMTTALDRMTSYCISKGEQGFDTLTYFWPMIVESKEGIGSEDMAVLFDHSFHEAIECSNREAAYFIWRQAPVANYRSMVSAAHCCGARNAYYAFGKAVENDLYDLVQFMWNKTDAEQHNGMLLADHAKAFCTAAERGYVDIAKLLWRDTTYNQRFVLLFEQSCAAFRRSCANGHVDIVRILWEGASVEQRRQILTMCQCEAISSACKNDRVKVVQYLWENLGDQLKSYLMDTRMDVAILSKCISESAWPSESEASQDMKIDGSAVLHYLFLASNNHRESSSLAPMKSQLFQALLMNEEAALMALLKRGAEANKWNEVADLLQIFDPEKRSVLCKKMSLDQARSCRLLPSINAAAAGVFPTVGNGKSTACIPKSSVLDR